ncbi:MAG: hypothetical protein ACRDMH_02455 [Solirubrobacterales bacterium]
MPGRELVRDFHRLGERELAVQEVALLRAAGSGSPRRFQRTAELLAEIGTDECSTRLRALARDALVWLSRAEGWSVPPGGITYRCEVCLESTTMWRRRAAAYAVDWGPVTSELRERGEAIIRIDRGYELRRTSIGDGRLIHWLLVCPRCARRRVRRCRHEASLDGRCERPAGPGRQYCNEHRSNAWRERRAVMPTGR